MPITPTIAIRRPKAKADVTVTGDIYAEFASNLDVYFSGKLVVVYGAMDLEEDLYAGEDWWDHFSEGGRLGIRIDKRTGEVHIIYMFDEYTKEDDGVSERYWGMKKYQLETYGTLPVESITYGTVKIANEEFKIKQLVYQETTKKKGNGKGAFGVTYPIVLEDVYITFTIKIDG